MNQHVVDPGAQFFDLGCLDMGLGERAKLTQIIGCAPGKPGEVPRAQDVPRLVERIREQNAMPTFPVAAMPQITVPASRPGSGLPPTAAGCGATPNSTARSTNSLRWHTPCGRAGQAPFVR
ncbi:hypothetical protein AB4305_26965 [Nocardia sp. 2YAB30]|uniref:hypothetical protein n=1 Tax=unclassified Nocardia TaxID=2637762 RepID=UPI003F998985